eukprot:TRINITY_DN600_c0_g1_i2.p1 TRINITY_DN600_c0_g1~~TRINITY_DN600_c0_g1_i2.p1  ORF type:complete len:190 (-),score=17.44 TRINITY_DN600_c0_g1_i2:27-596(-)
MNKTYLRLSLFFVFVLGVSSLDFECDACVFILQEAEKTLGENTTVVNVAKVLESLCSLLPFTEECDKLAVSIANDLPKIAHFIDQNPYDPYAWCSILDICPVNCCLSDAPEQVHISLTGYSNQVAVTWVTTKNLAQQVKYGLSPSTLFSTSQSTSRTYTNGGWLGVINTAIMTNLKPRTKYYYLSLIHI